MHARPRYVEAQVTPIDLSRHRRIVVLTGAGISAASGLPTYRGEGGLWTTTDVERYSTKAAVEEDPRRVWSFHATLRHAIARAAPNAAHLALAATERRLAPGATLTVLTQNVDGLHGAAGSSRVVELHGSLARSRCTGCDFSREEVLAESPVDCPDCPGCGAPLRADVVFFDEMLPAPAEWGAKKALREVDLFIAVGTSGTVWPAASYVRWAKLEGARTLLVSLEPGSTEGFDEVWAGRAEDVLPRLLG